MSQRLPYDQWLLTQTPEQLRARAMAKHEKELAKKATPKKKAYRKKAYRKPYIQGMGPYQLYGGLEGSLFGQKYNLGGNYYSEDFDPRSKGLRERKTTTVTGYGPYKAVRQNTLIKNIDLGMSPPMVRNTNKGEATVFNHSEYIGDLLSGSGTPTDFTLQSYAFNPGNSELFAFLGPIAHRFQEYEVRGVLFELRSLSSDYASSLSLGSMFMAADYNVVAPAPTDKIQLENMEYANSAKPSCSLIMPLECEPKNAVNTHLYIADDLNYEGSSEQLYDLCNIHIGSYGIPSANTPIAEIWMHYEIALFKPIVSSANAVQPLSFMWQGDVPTGLTPFGVGGVEVPGSSSLFTLAGNTFSFPAGIPGNYICVWKWSGAAAEITPAFPEITASGSASILNVMWNSAGGPNTAEAAYGYNSSNVSANNMVIVECINIADDGSSIGSITLATDGDFPDGALDAYWVDFFCTSFNSRLEIPESLIVRKRKKGSHIKTKKVVKIEVSDSSDDESSYETVLVKKKK